MVEKWEINFNKYQLMRKASLRKSLASYQGPARYLRNLYASSGLSIRPKTKIPKLERIEMFIESLGLNPDEILTREASSRPHRTVIDPESRKIEVLNEALKHAILKELRTA